VIELTINLIQLIFTAICTLVCVYKAYHLRNRAWALLGLTSAVFFLGDLYWQLYIRFYGESPHYSNISYLSWFAAYLFLFMLISEVKDRVEHKFNKALWLIPVFTTGMCLYYLQWGSYVDNIVSAVLMSMLIWSAVDCLIVEGKGSDKKWLYITILVFCLLEYLSWTASCHWMGDTLSNPYFWFDFLLSFTFLAFPLALRKAVGK